MKLHVMSDLHVDFYQDHGMQFAETLDGSLAEVLVIAGDLSEYNDYWYKKFLGVCCAKYKDVIMVPGNHEYYSSDVQTVVKGLAWINSSLPNLHILSYDNHVTIGAQRFVGGTLWFPDQPDNWRYENHIGDFHYIQGFKPWVYDEHTKFIADLNTNLSPDDVVITHHLPSHQCVNHKYKMSSINRFFVAEVSTLIVQRKPKIWIHGHTHEQVDMIIGQTRVLANPRGYPREKQDQEFNPKLVVEV
jgi:predicted phosphodiesterase